MMNILYTIKDSLYINITNRCPCSCKFCLRNEGDGIEGSDSLWLEREPNFQEVKDAFLNYNLDDFKEVVFCGYGEPLERIDLVVEIAKYIRSISNIKIRVNTNGLADLIHNKDTAIMLSGLVDSISISLNAPSKEEYNEIVRPKFGEKSFDALLKFATDAKKYIGDVHFSVVDVITEEQIERCKKLSNDMGIELRIREKI